MPPHPRTGRLPALLLAAGLVVAVSACKAPQAFGDRHSVIVRADSSLWLQVDSAFLDSLERRVFTTYPERAFKVTFVAENDTLWRDLRLWKQVVVLGAEGDEVVDRLLGKADTPTPSSDRIYQVEDVWAGGQTVTLLLLPPTGQPATVRSLADELYALLQERYDAWMRERMYASGVNDSLMQVLSAYGFTLTLPRVYVYGRQDSTFRFRNVYPEPADRIRSVVVTWSAAVDTITPRLLRAWRDSIDEVLYDPPQDVAEEGIRFQPFELDGLSGLEYRGVWKDRSDFPAAGPFIVRAVTCPGQGRTYFIDAWLYSPGEDKYPYVRQLEILLDSFRCSEEEPVRISRSGLGPRDAEAGG